MGVGPFSITQSRYKVVDFTTSFYEEPTSILIPYPIDSYGVRLLACTKPFKLTVNILFFLIGKFISLNKTCIDVNQIGMVRFNGCCCHFALDYVTITRRTASKSALSL